MDQFYLQSLPLFLNYTWKNIIAAINSVHLSKLWKKGLKTYVKVVFDSNDNDEHNTLY